MTSDLSRRLFLSGLAATLPAAGFAAPQSSLIPKPRPVAALARQADTRPQPRPDGGLAATLPDPEQLIAAAKLGGAVAFAVADARTGEVLEARGADMALPPASTAKVLTTLFAFDRLGTGHRFSTRLIAPQAPSGGRIGGDLVLAGGGDPTLDSDGLAELAQALRARGVSRVDGKLVAYAGALPYEAEICDGQPDHLAYNPAIAGLNLNYNRVYFEWKRSGKGYAVTMDARTDRLRPMVNCATMEVVNRKAPLYTWRDAKGTERWTVAGPALGKGGGRWLPVRHPGRYAGEVFRSLAGAQGAAIGASDIADAMPGGTVLAERQSAPLAAMVQDMLKWSTNLTAEVIGLAASGAGGQRESAAMMNRYLAASYNTGGIRMVDHSGLGPESRVTAGDMVRVLVAAAPGALPPLLKTIPLRDEKGRPQKGSPVQVVAKTGTLNFVSTLVGYADVPGGRRLAFAILTGDVKRRAALAEDDMDRPAGARSWNTRSKQLQQALIERWGALYRA